MFWIIRSEFIFLIFGLNKWWIVRAFLQKLVNFTVHVLLIIIIFFNTYLSLYNWINLWKGEELTFESNRILQFTCVISLWALLSIKIKIQLWIMRAVFNLFIWWTIHFILAVNRNLIAIFSEIIYFVFIVIIWIDSCQRSTVISNVKHNLLIFIF